ncbi:DUF1152 domain-containing protein [Deinococcus humi]|uniref:DUF1152 domain-containing protein n=1 Tax=Deinococcus humi TaxID=662880 RepID=A0A7W8JZL7_9DEIO|nr:DUF1152 domain-containing protein [Deinococcus humi]MBB5366132.1 hypothetical protein [Deinococcus humi]GGO40237.1 hypothetical protein GCM10008949_49490 [Deinococcus humi]
MSPGTHLLPPIFQRLEQAQTVLLAGAGGGFDLFCGLPLYFALQAQGKQVILANLSFSSLDLSSARQLGEALYEVRAQTQADLRYFPELHLARWLAHTGDVPVYAFARTGVQPILHAYKQLVEQHGVDTVILIDGGTDSLMRGDEAGLGTPEEDAVSLAAVQMLEGISQKLLVCLGFGVDTFHGVAHAQYLEAVAALTRTGAYLGTWSLTPEMPEVQRYREVLSFVHAQMPDFPSIVSSSILDAVDGQFGNYHSTHGTRASTLFINPLMGLYWAFEATGVAERNLYLDRLRETTSFGEVARVIATFREEWPRLKSWESIPL